MNFATVRTIFFKELLDTFRDRRTLIAMIGVPIVMYPALLILVTQVTLVQQSRLAAQVSRVAVTGPGAGVVREWLSDAAGVKLAEPTDASAALQSGQVDAVVATQGDVAQVLAQDGTASVDVRFDATEPRSQDAANRVEKALSETRDRLIAERVAKAGLAKTFAKPLEYKVNNVAPPAKSTGSILGRILPIFMVVMLGVGAFYPAVDLTAGEKERGTFETLLSTPATKLDIVAGKFLAVFGLSMLTGILNLASMGATLLFQLSQVSAADGGQAFIPVVEIPPQTAVTIFVMLVPLAFFISAMMMTVALLARSFREAQNYVSPFFLAIVLPALAGTFPGVTLNEGTAFIPISNVALLFRDLLTGEFAPDMAFLVFSSTAVYALLALLVATWMFQREEVVLSEEGVAPLTLDRSTLSPSPTPTAGVSLAIFAVVMLLIFYAGTPLQTWRLHLGLVLTQYGLILAPILLALWYGKVNIPRTLNLRAPGASAMAGTALAAIGWAVLSIQMSVLINRWMPVPKEFEVLNQRLFDVSGLPGGVWTLLAIVALSPAICEESLFRGVLLSGLRRRLPDWGVVVTVGVLFGFFHLSLYKLLPTALTGIVFTYLVVRSGSLFTSMLAHFTLNGLSILLATNTLPSGLVERLKSMDIETNGLPMGWLIGAGIVFVAGIAVVEAGTRLRRSEKLVAEH